MRGRKAVLFDYDGPFEIIEQEVPDPPPGWITINVSRVGICGSDLHHRRGDHRHEHGAIPKEGKVIGHEGFGIVADLGEGVSRDSLGANLELGDRVVFSGIFSCGHCRLCLTGHSHFCMNREGVRDHRYFPYFTGLFADYYLLPPGHPVIRALDALTPEELTSLNCALSCTADALLTVGVKGGDNIVVLGAGGLGLSSMAFASFSGATKVIAVDTIASRLETARQFGATETILASPESDPDELVAALQDTTDGVGPDVVVEVNGQPSSVQQALAAVRFGGTVVTMGCVVGGSTAEIDFSTMLRGKRLQGHSMYAPETLSRAMSFVLACRDRFPFAEMASKQFPLAKINDAFEAAEWQGRTSGSAPARVGVDPTIG